MTPVEVGLAALLALAGLRSLWHWGRRPLEGGDAVDLVLYALHLTARVGLWFAFAGLFVITALIGGRGRAFTDEFARVRWYLMVPVVLATLQFVTGYFLGRRRPGQPGGATRRPG